MQHQPQLNPDQSFVFLSRSTLSLGLPAIPKRYLALPSLIQFFVLVLLSLQSSHSIFSSAAYTPPAPPPQGVDRTITIVFLLICLEGLCGGSAYVNTFFHVGREGEDGGEGGEGTRRKMEREFRIGAVGAADSCGECCETWRGARRGAQGSEVGCGLMGGILFASLISMPTEVALCNAQIAAGRTTCRDL